MRMKRVAFIIVTCLIVLIACTGFSLVQNEQVELIVLMYHNVIPDKFSPNKYEVRLSDLRRDLQYIKNSGLPCITPSQLVMYTDGKLKLAKRNVMLTFDDGYYHYNTLLQQLLKEFDYTAVVSVVGDFTRYNKDTDSASRYIYMDYDDMQSMVGSGRAEIAAHSYYLHSLKGRLGVRRNKGESPLAYAEMFNSDCKKLEDKLSKIGIKPICYTYPYGAYCKESEQLIKQRGYSVSLTCNEKINIITRNKDSLYLLGRYNRDGVTSSASKIISAQWHA